MSFIRWSWTQFPPAPSISPMGFPSSGMVIYIKIHLNAIQACYCLIAAVLFHLIVTAWKGNPLRGTSCAVGQNIIYISNVLYVWLSEKHVFLTWLILWDKNLLKWKSVGNLILYSSCFSLRTCSYLSSEFWLFLSLYILWYIVKLYFLLLIVSVWYCIVKTMKESFWFHLNND